MNIYKGRPARSQNSRLVFDASMGGGAERMGFRAGRSQAGNRVQTERCDGSLTYSAGVVEGCRSGFEGTIVSKPLRCYFLLCAVR
jgi:hypothetical protein